MAILKFLYRQSFARSRWSAEKWLDCYETFQLKAAAQNGHVYQISAQSTKNYRSYPIFSLLVGRSVVPVCMDGFW